MGEIITQKDLYRARFNRFAFELIEAKKQYERTGEVGSLEQMNEARIKADDVLRDYNRDCPERLAELALRHEAEVFGEIEPTA